MFSFASFSSLYNLSLYLFQMPIKGVIFVLVGTFLLVRSSTPIKWSCVPSGFLHFQPLMTFTEAKDTGLLGFYVLYTPKKPRKLERCHKLWRKRSLILMLLLISGIESIPGEFICILFYQPKLYCLGYNAQKYPRDRCLILNTVQLESRSLKCE